MNDNVGRAAIVVGADDATNSAHMNFHTKSMWITGGNGGALPASAGGGLRLYDDSSRANIFAWNYANNTPRTLTLQEPGGNVGVGTTAPGAKLDVRGDIRLGSNGEYHAPAGEENLRIIRGVIASDGTMFAGAGFSVARTAEGQYTISLASPFSGLPAVTATVDLQLFVRIVEAHNVSAGGFEIHIFRRDNGNYTKGDFHFIAVGPVKHCPDHASTAK